MGYPEPTHLWQVGHTCRARWQLQGVAAGGPYSAEVSIGTLDTGGWYVDVIEQVYHPAQLVSGEQAARAEAERRMDELLRNPRRAGGQWVQVPCDSTGGWRPGEQEAQDATGSQTYSGADGSKSGSREHR